MCENYFCEIRSKNKAVSFFCIESISRQKREENCGFCVDFQRDSNIMNISRRIVYYYHCLWNGNALVATKDKYYLWTLLDFFWTKWKRVLSGNFSNPKGLEQNSLKIWVPTNCVYFNSLWCLIVVVLKGSHWKKKH